MFVAVNDDPKLGAPITQVIVRDRLVAKKTQGAGKRVADHCAADVSNVHRFGDVGRRKIDHNGSTVFQFGYATSRVT